MGRGMTNAAAFLSLRYRTQEDLSCFMTTINLFRLLML